MNNSNQKVPPQTAAETKSVNYPLQREQPNQQDYQDGQYQQTAQATQAQQVDQEPQYQSAFQDPQQEQAYQNWLYQIFYQDPQYQNVYPDPEQQQAYLTWLYQQAYYDPRYQQVYRDWIVQQQAYQQAQAQQVYQQAQQGTQDPGYQTPTPAGQVPSAREAGQEPPPLPPIDYSLLETPPKKKKSGGTLVALLCLVLLGGGGFAAYRFDLLNSVGETLDDVVASVQLPFTEGETNTKDAQTDTEDTGEFDVSENTATEFFVDYSDGTQFFLYDIPADALSKDALIIIAADSDKTAQSISIYNSGITEYFLEADYDLSEFSDGGSHIFSWEIFFDDFHIALTYAHQDASKTEITLDDFDANLWQVYQRKADGGYSASSVCALDFSISGDTITFYDVTFPSYCDLSFSNLTTLDYLYYSPNINESASGIFGSLAGTADEWADDWADTLMEYDYYQDVDNTYRDLSEEYATYMGG